MKDLRLDVLHRADLECPPIFVLGCAYRCGSTLLQRYITSTGEVLVWGEQHGLVAKAWPAIQRLNDFDLISAFQWKEFEAKGTNAWIANINPPFDGKFAVALRAFLIAYYTDETKRRGFRRWGFKENTYGLSVCELLLAAFPSARAVFLVRNPRLGLASAAAMPWYNDIGGAKGFADLWIANSASFLRATDSRILRISYEDFTENSDAQTERLADHLGLPLNAFNRDVLRQRVGGADTTHSLGTAERRELDRYELQAVMHAYGYCT